MAVATEAKSAGRGGSTTVGSARCARRSIGYAFIAIPMGFFFLFFIFPIGYAVYIHS